MGEKSGEGIGRGDWGCVGVGTIKYMFGIALGIPQLCGKSKVARPSFCGEYILKHKYA